MIAGKHTMMAKALPYEAEVEYLESTGTQYVDTGVVPVFPSDLEYRARIRWTNTTNRQIMGLQGGMYIGVVNGKYQAGQGGTNNVNVNVSSGVAYDFSAKFYLSNPNLIPGQYSRIDWSLDNSSGTVYDVLYQYKPANATVWLFWANDANTLRGPCAIYSFQILVNGVLVRDFIPVHKGMTGYLYDRVMKRLFGNVGSGQFILGPDKLSTGVGG